LHNKTPNDEFLAVQPSGQLEYHSPRTSFSTGYTGIFRRYSRFSQLDDSEQRAAFSLRERATRRLTFLATDDFVQAATTDLLQLNGVPFERTGGRYNDFTGGLEARLSRTIDLSTRFESTWVNFDHTLSAPIIGGYVNGVVTELSRRLNDRVSIGGVDDIRVANLNAPSETTVILFQEVGATFRYRVTDLTSVDASGGGAFLDDRTRHITRTGPFVKLDVMHRTSRATMGAAYRRSYIPALVLGGTNESQEATGYVQMPFAKNRWYVQEAVTWLHTDPFISADTSLSAETPLSSVWVQNLVGYGVTRWFRIEGYYQFAGQDNRQVQGKIKRHLAGVQVVVAQPVRIRQ
ncbi:MAG TPA: hypothetical protein VFZ98_04390, partial [Vicinamibacterales bacterium]